MGQPVIVENVPGANGGLAAGQVIRAGPGGYTLFFAVESNLVINPILHPQIAYDPFRDFVPISIVARLNMVLVAHPSVPARNVAELIAYAKQHQQAQLRRHRARHRDAHGHGAVQVRHQDRDQPTLLMANPGAVVT